MKFSISYKFIRAHSVQDFAFASTKMATKALYESILEFCHKKDSKNSKWKKILSDLFWPIETWPKHILLNMFHCEYKDRISIISFLYKNGFPANYTWDLIEFYARPSVRGTLWEKRKSELQSVWNFCEYVTTKGTVEQKRKYFFFSMYNKCVYTYNGDLKLFGNIVPISSRQVHTNTSPTFNDVDFSDWDPSFEKTVCEAADRAENEYAATIDSAPSHTQVLNEILYEIQNTKQK